MKKNQKASGPQTSFQNLPWIVPWSQPTLLCLLGNRQVGQPLRLGFYGTSEVEAERPDGESLLHGEPASQSS